MWRRSIAAGTIVAGMLAVTGGAIAAVGSNSDSTSTPSTSPTAPTITLPEETAGTSQPGGETTTVFKAGDAGTVTIVHSGDVLTVGPVDAQPGWDFEVEVPSGREVEVKFLSNDTRIDFNAELEDGEVRVRVRTRVLGTQTTTASTVTTLAADPAPTELGMRVIDLAPAGSITIEITEAGLALISVDASEGWTAVDVEVSASEIEVELRTDGFKVEAEAELDDGDLKVEVKMESDDDDADDDSDFDDDDSDDDDNDHDDDDDDSGHDDESDDD